MMERNYGPFNPDHCQPDFHTSMLLIIILALLYILKLTEVSFMENVSWWWVNGLAFLAFLWFEFIERALGLDKKTEDRMHDKMKEERIKRGFKKK